MQTLFQTLEVNASPLEVYNTWMNSEKHAALIDGEVEMSSEVGANFKLWGESINGQNIELVAGEKIVQKWRYNYENWPKNHYSTIKLELKKSGDKTIIHFTQDDLPEEFAVEIEKGWEDYYWRPLRTKFG